MNRDMNSGYLGFLRENSRFLAFGFLMALCSSYGQTFFISVFGGEIRAEFGLSHGTFGLIYSAATLLSGFCMIWAGGQIDRVDLRRFTVMVCAGLIVASLLTGWTTSAFMLGIAIFALRFSGQGLMSHTAMTAMARYFERDRGKAISMANLGFPAGQAIFPVIGVALAQVSAPAMLDFFEDVKNAVGDAQVEQPGGDVDFVNIEGPRGDHPGNTGQVHQGDDGDQ